MRALLVFLTASTLAGCASWFDSLAYKLPTRQGNVIEQKQLDQLKVGMTPDQVKFLLGTPLAASPFRDDRWDYVGYYKSPRGQVSSRTVSLFFENGQISRMEGIKLAAVDRAEAQRLETPDIQDVLNTDKKDRLEEERAKQTEAPRPTTGESSSQK
ncbi:MAG: outer membrane protein assembly factor BamE [Pseudomonadota bacterium]